jgi:outer membrane protein assembly factor BamD (BamD/ComL family)
MKRLVSFVLLALLALALPAAAQNRSAELDKAVEEARAAYNAYQQALARRDQGIESQAGERTASAAGGTRPNENYFARQAILEQQAELARQRYDAAMKRWNDLK